MPGLLEDRAMSHEPEGIQQHAIAFLEQSTLPPALIARAVALVPTIPTTKAGMPSCRACESVLCGACGKCHSLDVLPGDPLCSNDEDPIGAPCAAWWQAYHAVSTAIHEDEDAE
jgi:hypothetical protein